MAPLGARTTEEERRQDVFLGITVYQGIDNNNDDINNTFKT